MKRFLLLSLFGVAAFLIWSCGNDNPAGPALAPEAGSNSLLIVGTIEGQEDIGSGQFSTQFRVTVHDSLGQPVNDAVVNLVHAQLGIINLAWDSLTPGEYPDSRSGYTSGNYTLNVTRGTDSLVNGRVFAPDIHTIVYPTTADTLQQDQPFTVIWSRQYSAAKVEIETRDYGPALASDVGLPDNGSFEIPASYQVRDDQRVRIWRSNKTTLVTGRSGSTLTAQIRNAVEPIVVQ